MRVLFDNVLFFHFSDFIKERDTIAWGPASIPLQTSSSWSLNSLNSILTLPFSFTNIPPLLSSTSSLTAQPLPEPDWNHIPPSPHMITLSTQFRPDILANSKLRFPKDKSEESKIARWNYTEEQRQLAATASVPRDFAEFKQRVRLLPNTPLLFIHLPCTS
jgi:hypothetical protein